MKILGRPTLLDQGKLAIDPQIAFALNLSEGVELQFVTLQTKPGVGAQGRVFTLLATALPHGAWGNLIRASIRIEPEPGKLREAIVALNHNHLFCRDLIDITGVDLNKVLTKDPALEPRHPSELILPSATLVIEVPRHCDSSEIHQSLIQLIDTPNPSTSESAKTALQSLFQREKVPAQVDWLSPLATLNRIAGLRRESLIFQPLTQGARGLEVELRDWMKFFSRKGDDGDFLVAQKGKSLVVLESANSDEKVICWHFFDLKGNLLVEFDVVVPAWGLESYWWQYILESISEARGTILSSVSHARADVAWSRIRILALFPLSVSEETGSLGQDPQPIIYCFRRIQGQQDKRSPLSDDFRKFSAGLKERAREIGSLLMEGDQLKWWAEREPDTSSLLQEVHIWDSSESEDGRFQGLRFAPNPYSFTKPLDLEAYDNLYDPFAREGSPPVRSRRRLAERVIEKLNLTDGNVAIVGAHRTGKTSVLMLVRDILRKPPRTLIPLWINASVTPPHLLLFEVIKSIDRFTPPTVAAPIRSGILEGFKKWSRAALSATTVKIPISSAEGEFSFDKLFEGLASHEIDDETEAQLEQFRQLTLRSFEDGTVTTLELLRLSLSELQRALQDLPGPQLLIILDEFSESTAWGHKEAMPVWRHAIESRDFSRIRWLISTSHPIEKVAEYSPITNVFSEINVGPLLPDETKGMLDAYSADCWIQETIGRRAPDDQIRPLITNQARVFLTEVTSSLPYLLQVCCFHTYDRATRTHFPMINRSLCRKTIVDKVLPELSDYFEHQWAPLPDDARRAVLESLAKLAPQGDMDFLKNIATLKVEPSEMSPRALKALARSGLRGDDAYVVAPLVALWVRKTGAE